MIALPTFAIDQESQDLQERVALHLQQRHLTFGSRLQIDAQRGVVTLSGQVPTFHQRQLIHAFTRRVAGVIQVIDQLEVELPLAPTTARSAGNILDWSPEATSSSPLHSQGAFMS